MGSGRSLEDNTGSSVLLLALRRGWNALLVLHSNNAGVF
jgi:hypothetical protein